ncbi:MAG: tetratricopeptide repeat protein [bacterium]|nr:tetratricopeptide repeat protein [bacterium]
MRKMRLLIVAVAVSLLAVERSTHWFQAIAHELSPSSMGGGTIVGPTILPRQAQQMLSTVEIISMAQQGVTDVSVSASVLCFCLRKAGDNVQELRRLRNEKFDNGAVLFKAGKYAQAITAFTKAIRMNLRDAAVYI